MTDAFEGLSPEAMLRRTAWLDAIARELVADPHAAQDAVQDAWLAALRHRGRIADLGPWLGQVVRHLAMRRGRREASRPTRERNAARAEAQPSSLDLLLRVQQQHRIVAAVLALDEPYRTAVLMRFFDALPPRAIAARTGVPVATVRTRLRRGLERLRSVLDAEAGGRAAWVGPLAAGLTVPTGSWMTLIGVMMNAKLLAGGAVAAAAIVAVVLWARRPENPRGTRGSGGRRAPATKRPWPERSARSADAATSGCGHGRDGDVRVPIRRGRSTATSRRRGRRLRGRAATSVRSRGHRRARPGSPVS